MATKFRFNYNNQTVDFDDYYVRSDIFTQGNLWLWGSNFYGNLGDSTIVKKSSPIQTVAYGNNWNVISMKAYFSAGIKSDGTLWMWGNSQFGILGDNAVVHRSSPVQTVTGGTNWKSVSVGYLAVAGIKTDGSLWTWGGNSVGGLGDNTTVNKSSPVQVIGNSYDWIQVAASESMHGIKTDGTLWCWGRNNFGQLGDNSSFTVNKSSPVQTVSGGNNWKSVSAGYRHVCAIKTDGTLWLWGSNGYGQLGDNTTIDRSSPVQTVTGGTNWKQAVCGRSMTGAIKNDGTLWLWGRNSDGNLGDNTTANKSSPIQTVSAGNNWKSFAGGSHSLGLKIDGTIWSWGLASDGQLGNNAISRTSSPVQIIGGGNNWKSIAAGQFSSAALTYIN